MRFLHKGSGSTDKMNYDKMNIFDFDLESGISLNLREIDNKNTP